MILTPPFRIRQTNQHVLIEVDIVKSENDASLRAVVDHDHIFGLAGTDAYLPLLFPQGTLCNGSTKWQEQQSPSLLKEILALSLERVTDSSILISIPKAEPGKEIPGLDTLKPSVFDVPSSGDAQQDEEERLAGLEMLQRGMEAVRKQEAEESVRDGLRAPTRSIQPFPSLATVGPEIKTRLHEYMGELPSMEQRRDRAEKAEEEKWDEGMYLDSFVDEEGEIKHLLNANLTKIAKNRQIDKVDASKANIQEQQRRDAHLLLLQLLLAYAYDRRTTLADPTVESAWTIAILCRSLVSSCMPISLKGDNVTSIVRSSIRRQLCFTLYRNWQLSLRIATDVSTILRQKEDAFTALQQIQVRFEEGEDDVLPLYNQSVIQPLLFWFDELFSTQTLSTLANELDHAISTITKEQVGPTWDLELLEDSAREAIAQGEGGFV